MAKASETIQTGMLYRSAEFERAAVDAERRTVRLSFSSEEPVERWFGYEILDHSPGSVDLSRIKAGGALLVDHDTGDQVGVVEEASVGADRKGRATVRFGTSARANEIFQDVKDGIRRLVSVGYRVSKLVTEKVEKAEARGDMDVDAMDSAGNFPCQRARRHNGRSGAGWR